MDPSAWIEEECYPSGFQWADPSKIRVAQVFQLLDHWRQREKAGLTPLIWNPECDLLANGEQRSERIRRLRQSNLSSDHDEEEDFGTELNKISEHPESHSSSPPSPPSRVRSPTSPVPPSPQYRSSVPFPSFCGLWPTHMLHLASSDSDRNINIPPSEQTYTARTYNPGEHSNNSSDIFPIHLYSTLDTGEPSEPSEQQTQMLAIVQRPQGSPRVHAPDHEVEDESPHHYGRSK
jgi:hypothetical protein